MNSSVQLAQAAWDDGRGTVCKRGNERSPKSYDLQVDRATPPTDSPVILRMANVSALTRKRQSEGTEGPPSDGDCRVQRPVSWPEGKAPSESNLSGGTSGSRRARAADLFHGSRGSPSGPASLVKSREKPRSSSDRGAVQCGSAGYQTGRDRSWRHGAGSLRECEEAPREAAGLEATRGAAQLRSAAAGSLNKLDSARRSRFAHQTRKKLSSAPRFRFARSGLEDPASRRPFNDQSAAASPPCVAVTQCPVSSPS